MNLLGILYAWMFSMNRALINGEFALLYLLAAAPRRRPWLIFALGMLLVLAELLIVIQTTLFFLDWRDLMELLRGEAVPVHFIVKAAVGIGLYAAVAAWIAWGKLFARRSVAIVMLCIPLAAVATERIQRAFFGYSDAEANHVFFPAAMLAQKFINEGSRKRLLAQLAGDEEARLEPLSPAPRLYQVLSDAAGDSGIPSTTLILIESWGYEGPAPLQRLLDATLLKDLQGRRVETGAEDSWGSTIYGEFRVLCGKHLYGVRVPRERIPDDCIPGRFSASGAQTRSFHGYQSRFYQRDNWYPQLGFRNSHWRSDLGGAECNFAFSATCDRDVLAFFEKQLAQPERSFNYVLTLDTHLPITSRARQAAHEQQAGSATPLAFASDYRIYSALLERTLAQIGDLIRRHPEGLFAIAGDHAPYLLLNTAEGKGLAKDRVPYVIVYPRDAAPAGNPVSPNP